MNQPKTAPKLTGDHLAMSECESIRNRFHGHSVVILASGPSLSDKQIDLVSRAWNRGECIVVTVNSTWRKFPMADIHFSNDADWFAANLPDMIQQCRGEFWCSHPDHTLPNVHYLPFDKAAKGLRSAHKGAIAWGGNSGAAAISFCALAGSQRLLLVGYDQQGEHWHEPHPESIRKGFNFPLWAEYFAQMAKDAHKIGMEIVNCSIKTSLDCFPRGDLAQELAKCSRC